MYNSSAYGDMTHSEDDRMMERMPETINPMMQPSNPMYPGMSGMPGMWSGMQIYYPFMYYPMQPYRASNTDPAISQFEFGRRRGRDFDNFFFFPFHRFDFDHFFFPFRRFDFDDFFFPFIPFRFF